MAATSGQEQACSVLFWEGLQGSQQDRLTGTQQPLLGVRKLEMKALAVTEGRFELWVIESQTRFFLQG